MAASSADPDIFTFRLKQDFHPGDVEWEEMIAAVLPTGSNEIYCTEHSRVYLSIKQ